MKRKLKGLKQLILLEIINKNAYFKREYIVISINIKIVIYIDLYSRYFLYII